MISEGSHDGNAGPISRQRSEESLKRAATLFQINDAARVTEERDEAAPAIIERARDHDLLLLGMREESWFHSFFFGTLAQQITGQVKCATLLVKAHATRRSELKRLLRISS